MNPSYCVVSGIWVLCCVMIQTTRAEDVLHSPCPVSWSGIPLAKAVRELAARCRVPYILDASVTDAMAEQPVRLVANHLDGRQAIRWTARAAGLDAVLVDGAVVIARPDRLPEAWRVANAAGSDEGGAAASRSRWEAAQKKRADMQWTDVPLSRVSRDVSGEFGVDMLFEASILNDQPLVRLEGQGLSIADVMKSVSDQLHATARFEDGAIWVLPGSAASGPASAPEDRSDPPPAGPAAGMNVLALRISIDCPGPGADSLERALRQAGVNGRVRPAGETGRVKAEGTVLEILQAGRLLEGWTWAVTPGGSAGPVFLDIRAAEPGRSVR